MGEHGGEDWKLAAALVIDELNGVAGLVIW
jgi:hypothetical protein